MNKVFRVHFGGKHPDGTYKEYWKEVPTKDEATELAEGLTDQGFEVGDINEIRI